MLYQVKGTIQRKTTEGKPEQSQESDSNVPEYYELIADITKDETAGNFNWGAFVVSFLFACIVLASVVFAFYSFPYLIPLMLPLLIPAGAFFIIPTLLFASKYAKVKAYLERAEVFHNCSNT